MPVSCSATALEDLVAGEAGESFLAEAVTAPPGGWRAAIKKPDTLPWQPMVLHRRGYLDGASNQERTLLECFPSNEGCQGLDKRPNPFSLIEI